MILHKNHEFCDMLPLLESIEEVKAKQLFANMGKLSQLGKYFATFIMHV